MSKVRSSELEIGLSFNYNLVEGDTTISTIREVRAFHALEEVCGLDDDTLCRFRGRFQFPDRVKIRLPYEEKWACHFFPGRYASTKLPSSVDSGSLFTRLLWSFGVVLDLFLGNLCPIRGG